MRTEKSVLFSFLELDESHLIKDIDFSYFCDIIVIESEVLICIAVDVVQVIMAL